MDLREIVIPGADGSKMRRLQKANATICSFLQRGANFRRRHGNCDHYSAGRVLTCRIDRRQDCGARRDAIIDKDDRSVGERAHGSGLSVQPLATIQLSLLGRDGRFDHDFRMLQGLGDLGIQHDHPSACNGSDRKFGLPWVRELPDIQYVQWEIQSQRYLESHRYAPARETQHDGVVQPGLADKFVR
jgi:hypothetical protein